MNLSNSAIGLATLVMGVLLGWYSKQVLNTLKSIRYQLKKQGVDPLSQIRVQSAILAPKPPDEYDG